MTLLEMENWKLIRARGRGRFFLKTILIRFLWFSIPVAITLLVARLDQTDKGDVAATDHFLILTLAGVALLFGIGDAWYIWATHEREYLRKLRFLEQPSPRVDFRPAAADSDEMSPDPEGERQDDTLSEDALIREAQRYDHAHSRGLIDLDAECAKLNPIYKMSLARDTFCLAGKAGVSEKAAFLALMGQFDN
jgi:hypothetical protein